MPLRVHLVEISCKYQLKKIDTDTGAKNSITDLGINTFTLISSIILILGLSDKIYI